MGALRAGDVFLSEGEVVSLTSSGQESRGLASLEVLLAASATYQLGDPDPLPTAEDWVLVIGDDVQRQGPWRLADVLEGERFASRGRVFDAGEVAADGVVTAVPTELVLSRVQETFEHVADDLIDARVRFEDGTESVITATPEHPFYVPGAAERWVPLGELPVGSALHVDSGAGALLVSKTWRQGGVPVFNFEVEGVHNYFVGAEARERGGLLVHNKKASLGDGGTVGGEASKEVDKVVKLPSSKYPESAAHARDAQAAGHPDVLTIDRPGAPGNRGESLKGIDKVPGKQLDEYPPAMFKEGGAGASVRPVTPSDNMGAGACIGNQCRGLPDGATVRIEVE